MREYPETGPGQEKQNSKTDERHPDLSQKADRRRALERLLISSAFSDNCRLPDRTMAHFELSRRKRSFFRIWVVVLAVLWIIAVLIAIFKFAK